MIVLGRVLGREKISRGSEEVTEGGAREACLSDDWEGGIGDESLNLA